MSDEPKPRWEIKITPPVPPGHVSSPSQYLIQVLDSAVQDGKGFDLMMAEFREGLIVMGIKPREGMVERATRHRQLLRNLSSIENLAMAIDRLSKYPAGAVGACLLKLRYLNMQVRLLILRGKA